MNFTNNISIFKKLLIAPLITLILFLIILSYTFFEHSKAQKNIQEVQEHIQPRLELASKNIILFESIHKAFSDAVAAKELSWIDDISFLKSELDFNLNSLIDKASSKENINNIKNNFEEYFSFVELVSKMLIESENIVTLRDNEELIPKMINLKERSKNEFIKYKEELQKRFDSKLTRSNKALDNILYFGLFIGIFGALASIVITLIIALPIRNSISLVISSLKALAQKEPDFKKRLYYTNKDEIGEFVEAFNSFTVKVKESYDELEQTRNELEVEKTKAEKATKYKSLFLANMSHEIRTPMNGIIGMMYLVKQTNLNTQQKEFMEKIERSANLLLGIINDILDFSKIEAGKLSINKQATYLKKVIEETFLLLEDSALKKGLSFTYEYINVSDPCVNIDSLRLSQILTNLLSNAIKFTNNGSVSLKVLQNESTYRFSISDTGIGMNSKQQDKLFHSFSQADESTTREFGGTGLGLAICKQLVEMMDGKIWVESKEDVGSTFIFELEFEACSIDDLKQTTKLDLKELKEKLKKISPTKVILAEDNEMNQEIVHSLLDDMPIEILDASDGSVAVNLYKKYQNDISLIFMDLQMPIMDGYEASSIIRKIDKDIPIIAISANALEEDANRSKNAGVNKHINKPINVYELFSSILEFIEKDFEPLKTQEIQLEDCILDKNLGLKYVDNNILLYEKLLKSFYNKYKTWDSEILTMDISEKKLYIHTFKGMSGTLGINKLYKFLKQYEHEDNETNKKFVKNAFDEYVKYIDLNENTTKTDTKKILKNISKEELNEVLNELKDSLESFMPKKIKEVIEKIDTINIDDDLSKKLIKVKENVALYKFEEALEVLNG